MLKPNTAVVTTKNNICTYIPLRRQPTATISIALLQGTTTNFEVTTAALLLAPRVH